MVEFEFVDDLPPTVRRGNDRDLLENFATALRKQPGRWAMWPVAHSNPSSYTTDIKNGYMTPFRGGQFDAVSRNGVLYVRYIGKDGGS